MKRYIKSSTNSNIGEYKGYKIYESPEGCYIYTEQKGQGKVEFPTEKEAREYIDTLK